MSRATRVALAVGIDVGFSATSRSTGVVLIDRATKIPLNGCKSNVLRQSEAIACLKAELARLEPSTVTACVDGPFGHAAAGWKARAVERFFASGPFASVPPRGGKRLRVAPAPTTVGAQFLKSTQEVLAALSPICGAPLNPLALRDRGTVAETFPTVFMATLLPPQTYTGKRSTHSDDLWTRLVTATRRSRTSPLIMYLPLMDDVEDAPRCDLHDLRAAAICAIAADLLGSDGSLGKATFIGTTAEGGFLLPPVEWWDMEFRCLLEEHLADRKGDLRLEWLTPKTK